MNLSGVASPTSAVTNIIPYGFYFFGKEFHNASKAIGIRTGAFPVKLYLIGHALELFIKSFLLLNRITKADLKSRNFGHNLKKLIDAAKDRGIGSHVTLDAGIETELITFNRFYQSKQLEYFSIATIFIQHDSIPLKKIPILTEELELKLEPLVRKA